MRLIGLMVLRNEEWIAEAAIKAALRWVDGLAIFLDRSTDGTLHIIREIAKDAEKEIIASVSEDTEHWEEMYNRQKNLEDGRSIGGTHFAIIDADEILTANNLPMVRGWFEALEPGQVIDLPMIAPWGSLDLYSPHTRGVITLGFRDMEGLGWAPRGDEQYHHHNRPPHGYTGRIMPITSPEHGGVFHLQWASMRRVKAKHCHYQMSEAIRWGYPNAEINEKYHWWAKPPHGTDLLGIPADWWEGYERDKINLRHIPWYEWEIKKMVRKYGPEKFEGMDLFGYNYAAQPH